MLSVGSPGRAQRGGGMYACMQAVTSRMTKGGGMYTCRQAVTSRMTKGGGMYACMQAVTGVRMHAGSDQAHHGSLCSSATSSAACSSTAHHSCTPPLHPGPDPGHTHHIQLCVLLLGKCLVSAVVLTGAEALGRVGGGGTSARAQATHARSGIQAAGSPAFGWVLTGTHSMHSRRLMQSGPHPSPPRHTGLHWQIMMSSSSWALRLRCPNWFSLTSCHTAGSLR